MNDLILVDGTNLVHRMHYVHRNLTNKKGMHTGAIYGFFKMLMYYTQKLKSRNYILCWEGGGKNWRTEILPTYKGNRTKVDYNISVDEAEDDKQKEKLIIHEAILMIIGLANLCGMVNINKTNFESDDIIAYLVKKFRKNIKIISRDKDMMQFVNDKQKIRVVYPDTNNNHSYTLMNEKEVQKKFEVFPEEIVDLLSLIGDKADNIPGITGIGEKRGIKIVKEMRQKNIKTLLTMSEYKIYERNLTLIDLKRSPIQLSKQDINLSNEYFQIKKIKNVLKLLEIKSFSIVDLMRIAPTKKFRYEIKRKIY